MSSFKPQLPRDHDAERLLLGAIVAFPECSTEVFQRGVRDSDFVDKAHRAIFSAMLSQHRRGLIIDPPLTREESAKVLAACPDAQWQLLFALSRYGGLRCPSEHLALRFGAM